MKRSATALLTLVALCSFGNNYAQNEGKPVRDTNPVLITIGGSDVRLSEFENIYHKNNNAQVADPKTIAEYVTLFVNFKLKVKEAEDMGLDTTKAFRDELMGYRKQLAQPYLIDKQLNEDLIKEAYDRLQTDVKASHLLVRLKPDASPSDTLSAYNMIMDYRKRLVKGTEFDKIKEEVAESIKDKQVLAEELGYFTAFQMVYPFENAAYNTEVGKVSEVVKTRFGYHVIAVLDKRQARGQIKCAHIMVKATEKQTEEESAKAKNKIDELYQKLKDGEDFVQLAKNHSDDKGSGKKGGALPWFGTGRMVPEFEEAAFALANDGDMSIPVKSKYGWHIIKRLEIKEIGSFEDMKSELKNKVSRDARAAQSRKSLIRKIQSEYGYEPNMNEIADFYNSVDETYFAGTWSVEKVKDLTKTIFTLKDTRYSDRMQDYSQIDFANYLKKRMRKQKAVEVKILVNKMYEKWVEEECVKFEEKNLEAKYPPFKALMQEYRDGILLFELMDDKVWSKAVTDTAGLKAYYAANKANFLWEERLDASIFTCANADIAKQAKVLAKKGAKKGMTDSKIKEEINKDSQLNLKIESGKFLKKDNKIIDKITWETGLSDNMDMDGKVVFVLVREKLAPQPKTLLESKGLVTAEYQSHLEELWIKELQEKYEVHVNREVLSLVEPNQ